MGTWTPADRLRLTVEFSLVPWKGTLERCAQSTIAERRLGIAEDTASEQDCSRVISLPIGYDPGRALFPAIFGSPSLTLELS